MALPQPASGMPFAPVPDVIGDDCSVLFCGINPGLLSGATGHHFARPGNRFWKALALGGLVERVLDPSEERELVAHGIGITNLVARVTATAKEITSSELVAGAELLRAKVERVRPEILAVLGVGAWRAAVDKKAQLGRQSDPFGGAVVYVLPNPSGLQARYQLPELASLFADVGAARDLERERSRPPRGRPAR